MAAGHVAKTWHTSANIDQFVARLALKDSHARDWVAVYESRKGLRIERSPFALALARCHRGAAFSTPRRTTRLSKTLQWPRPRRSRR